MKNIKIKKYIVGLLFSVFAYTPVYAADAYLGGGLGQSEINQSFFGEYGNGYKIFGGMRVHRNLSIEVAYLDYGNPRQNFIFETDAEGWSVGAWAKGLWPVSQNIELFGKAGLAYWETEQTTTIFGPPLTTSEDGIDVAWAVGAKFNYWDKVSVQLEYEDIEAGGDITSRLALWSISALYTF